MTFIKSKIHYSLLMITISSMLILGCKKKPVDEPAPVGPMRNKIRSAVWRVGINQ